MRLSILSMIAFSVIALLLSGCAQKTEPVVSPQPAAPAEPQAPVEVKKPCSDGNVLQKDDCFLKLAKAESDPEVCRNIYSESSLDSCYAQFADNDLRICMRIADSDMKASCLTKNAVREKSEDGCKLIDSPEKRQDCLRQVLPPCMLISDTEARLLCLAFEKGDFSVCRSDSCFMDYATNRSEPDACLLINSTMQRHLCNAAVAKNASLCNEAALAPIRDLCAEKAAQLLDDKSACSIATPGSAYRNRCYQYFAVSERQSSICNEAEPETSRDECYLNYSVEAANTSSCPKVQETLNRQNCYYSSAIKNRMPSLCNGLATQGLRNDCYSRSIFADAGPLPTDCALVESLAWADKCFYMAAKATGDSSLCPKISADYDKLACNSLFGSNG